MGKITKREEGAIVVEASIAVPVYVFIIFTILSIVNICYAQTKVQVALNSAARHLSEISYVMYVTGLADTSESGKTSATAQQISDNMNQMLEQWGGEKGALSDISEMIGSTSLSKVLNSAAATVAMDALFDSEFKTTKGDDPDALKKWLKIDGDIAVHAVVSDNDVLVAGAYYKIKVIDFLNIDFTFNFHSGTMTFIWTNKKDKTPDVGGQSSE